MSDAVVPPPDAVNALRRVAFLLERRMGDTYKVKAFRKAADTLLSLPPGELDRRCQQGTLRELEGIGRATAGVVEDVHAFPGHITCDARSASEIVVPVRGRDGALLAVLDIDSSERGAFDDEDRVGLERLVSWFARPTGR